MWSRRHGDNKQHPDPVIELKLQHIMSLDQLRAGCLRQIEDARGEIMTAREQVTDAVENYAKYSLGISATQLATVHSITAQRVQSADESIREQRAVITSLQQQIETAIEEANLTPFDLAYLHLASR